MSSKAFTSSNGGDPVSRLFTFGEKMRVLRQIRNLEFGMLDRGAKPEQAVYEVYRRALDYYDSVWPNDEGGFRNTLLRMHEKRLAKIIREKRRKTDWDGGYKDAHGDRLG